MSNRQLLSPPKKALEAYHQSLAEFEKLGVKHETAVRSAFQVLLDDCARQIGCKLVPEYPLHRRGHKPLRADGAVVDEFNLVHGLWEAKDAGDDLEKEIRSKLALGYPDRNILFQSPDRAVICQNGKRVLDTELSKPEHLTDVLREFLNYEEPAIEEWDKASDEFKDRIAEQGRALAGLLAVEQKKNPVYKKAFTDFVALCQSSINPNLSLAAVEEMLVQHLLTWRIFKGVFGIGDFMQKNVIAQEIEKVVLTIRSFSREDFLKKLDRFYAALEHAAATITDFSEKQKFLNTVYERFFQGFAVKQADALGIVYTPQPIVDFMVASVGRLLEREFGKSLAHKNVHILDGFTGTGNFIVNLMRSIPRAALPHKYAEELHCNEVMLLPYYVASMNIEHAYWEATGEYRAFEGICLVDTFGTAEKRQAEFSMFNEQNSERVARQKRAPIFVCIGNPPYNAWQQDENDNNKNRKYAEVDRRIAETYSEDSAATLKNSLSDPYVKAIRWASDRIGGEGIVAFVTNNGFIDGIAADGMRKHLAQDFDLIYLLDLGGNVRKNPKLSGTTHNVFGIQVGVSVNIFIRLPHKEAAAKRSAKIFYHAVPTDWRKTEKYRFLQGEQPGEIKQLEEIEWTELKPDKRHNWLESSDNDGFSEFMPIGLKGAKGNAGINTPTIFSKSLPGVSTKRDGVVFDFLSDTLERRITEFIRDYNSEVNRYKEAGRPKNIDNFVDYSLIKWSSTLKLHLERGDKTEFNSTLIRRSLYRPFTRLNLYYDSVLNDRPSHYDEVFPTQNCESENRVICVNLTAERPFVALVTNVIPESVCTAGFGSFSFAFPFYTYEEDGTNRRENIPLNTLIRFQTHYGDDKLTKWDIFHYVYALMHHPGYRERFAANLKRELPRIPFATEFRAFAKAGKRLAELHTGYEQAAEYPLKRRENRDVPLNWRVEKMKLTPDKRTILYNEFLTLEGLPPEVFDYKLGNRSALDWVIDQYQVSIDPRSGIESDPNRPDDEQYIVRLVGQIVYVSLETLKIVKSLPADFGAGDIEPTPRKELREWRMSQTHWMNSADAQSQREELEASLVMQETPPTSKPSAKSSSNGPATKASRLKRRIG
jgi:predicted helicase